MWPRVSVGVVALALPLAGLALLLAVPHLDVQWEHHPSHFWLVLSVAFVNVVLGLMTSEASTRRDDARLFLVSLALLASAGFLALHALATPGVLLAEPNTGFTVATPIGLFLAAGFAAASAMEPEGREGMSTGVRRALRLALGVLIVGWAVASLAQVPFLDRPPPEEAPFPLRLVAPLAIGLYGFAAVRYFRVYRERTRALPLAVAVAFVLLAEAVLAVVFARSWHATWWEWHLLMAVAFGTIVVAARSEYRREGSVTAAMGGLYLEETLRRLDHRNAEALAELAGAAREDRAVAPIVERLRALGFNAEEVVMLERSARELARVDSLLSRYVGPHLADRLQQEPSLAQLGGTEVDVTVLFADLVGFTTYAEGRPAGDVIGMLNTYWEAAVPTVVEREGGMIERFAGDAIMAVFNALDDQPDHPMNAARAALGLRHRSERIAAEHPDWPRFRIGVNTGPAVIGNVGASAHHSFSAIGDTTNVAARIQAVARPGHALLAGSTYERVRERVRVEPIGVKELKGRQVSVEVYELVDVEV